MENIEFEKFIREPDIDMYPGIIITEETNIKYETENLKQEISNLKLVSDTTNSDENLGFTSLNHLEVNLQVGDILIFEKKRGFIKPLDNFSSIDEAISLLNDIKK